MYSQKPLRFTLILCLAATCHTIAMSQGELRRGASGSGDSPELRLPNPPARRRPAPSKPTNAQSSSNRTLKPPVRQTTGHKESTPITGSTASTSTTVQSPTIPTTSSTGNDRVDEEIELGNLARDLGNAKLDQLQEGDDENLARDAGAQYTSATRHYRAAAQLDPSDFRPFFGLGAIYVDGLQRHMVYFSHDEAIKNFQQSIERNREFAPSYVGLSYASTQNRQYEQAIAASQEAIRLQPDYAEAYYTLGSAYHSSDRAAQAVQFYRKAISLKPSYDRAYRTLGSVYITLKDPVKRLEVFKEWVRASPQNADAFLNLGSGYYENDQYEEGVATFKQVLKLKPNWTTAYYQLGLCYYRMGDQESALAQYRILQKLDPEAAAAYYRLINR